MPLSQLAKSDKQPVKVSFEFFPAASDAGEASLMKTVHRLAGLAPEFVSVTYGAGGSTRDRTLGALGRILSETGVPVASHLTCVDATREDVHAVVATLKEMNISRIVALRGDPRDGVGGRYVPPPGGYANAAELVAGLGRLGDFDITVSAYPEKHPESATIDADIDMLKRKADNGATRAVTQFFFDNDDYERYVERARARGITIPIVPGILPIHHFGKVASFSGKCGATIPAWLAERFDGLDDDPETRSLVSAAVAAEQVADLAARGVDEFHFYTMNRAELTLAICRLLGIRENGNAPNGMAA
ncbi:MAG: methylenetetrahydrofolate reductase [NAD(P)H] [Nitratireductor sp.]|nr:methylenetetrahydrofolate reductase [NAD(P)H] [Nitratireductor sp.]